MLLPENKQVNLAKSREISVYTGQIVSSLSKNKLQWMVHHYNSESKLQN